MTMSLLILLLLAYTARAKVLLYPIGGVVSVCEGDPLAVSCVTDTGKLLWSIKSSGFDELYIAKLIKKNFNAVVYFEDTIFFRLINVSGSVLTSAATAITVPLSLNGTVITCSDIIDEANATLLIQGPPSKPIKLRFTAPNFTSATLFWMPPTDSPNCVHSYTVLLDKSTLRTTISFANMSNSSHEYTYHTTSTSLNVTGLSRGVEYTFTVTGRDRVGRVGESETMLLSLEVPKKLVNLKLYLSWDSNEVVLASWKQQVSSHPPVEYYIIRHNTTSDGSVSEVISHQTNITIHGAQPGSVYFIQVTPVNVLGPGPPTTTILSNLDTLVNMSDPTATLQAQSCSCSGPLLKLKGLGFTALNFTSATLFWMPPTDSPNCVYSYTILLDECSHMTNLSDKDSNSSHECTYKTTSTSLNVTGLRRGVKYTFTVTWRDKAGMVRDVEGIVLLNLEVPKRIVIMKIYSTWASNEVLLLASWEQPASSRPPVDHYIIRHNTTSDGSVSKVISHQTNITIHGARPGSVYFIQVTPVNVLGPGPPTTTAITVECIVSTTIRVTETTTSPCQDLLIYLPISVGASVLLLGTCLLPVYFLRRAKHAQRKPATDSTTQHTSNNNMIPEEEPDLAQQTVTYETIGPALSYSMTQNPSYSTAVQAHQTESNITEEKPHLAQQTVHYESIGTAPSYNITENFSYSTSIH